MTPSDEMLLKVADEYELWHTNGRDPSGGALAEESLPLARHPLADSRDAEVIRRTVGGVLSVPRLLLVENADLHLHLHGLQLECGGIYYLDYGTGVRIDTTWAGNCHLVQVPLAGRASISVERHAFVATAERGAVIAPGRDLSLTLDQPSRSLLLRVDHDVIQRLLRKKLDREPVTPLTFEAAMDLTTPANRTFRDMLDLFVGAVDSMASPLSLAVREFERLLVSQLLLGQPHNYLQELDPTPRPFVARSIARAAEFIEAHAHEPLIVDDIAHAVGLPTRALQVGFRRYYDTTPTAFLREVRLRRVRTELMQGEPDRMTVTAIASRWGFLHPGRFSVMYRDRFGEPPSQTLGLMTDGSCEPEPSSGGSEPAG